MAEGDAQVYSELKKIRYLRQKLNSLKQEGISGVESDLVSIVERQQRVVNSLTGNFAVEVSDMDQRQLKNVIRIFGVPENLEEDTTSFVLKFVKEKMNIELQASDIDVCYRIGVNRGSRPVVVKFVSHEAHKKVWRRKDMLKNTVFDIVEELCLERAKILKAATRKFGKKCVSIVDGAVEVNLPGENKRFLTIWQFWKFETEYRQVY